MLTTGSPRRVRSEVTRYVSTFVLCGVMALFAGLLSVGASSNQTTIDQGWPAARVIRVLPAPHDEPLDKDVDDPGADGRGVELAPLGRDALSPRSEVLYTRIAALADHADGQWLRAP